ncbi:M56 family metallopeptidase [Paenibacillus sp. TRM 82003]|nr:M56 family metallopeptidase [Paenibacillus sp. TRM 82003]
MATALVFLIFAIKWGFKEKLKPRWTYLLWMLLLLRLVLPWTPESSFSMFNFLSLDNYNGTILEESGRSTDPKTVTMQLPTLNAESVTLPTAVATVSLKQIGSVIWLAGTIMTLGIIVFSNVRFALKVKNEPRVQDPNVLSILEIARHEMGIRRNITLMKSNRVASPTLLGVLKPKLLMPKSGLDALSAAEMRFIFLHECSHVKRNDIATNWLMNALLVLHWFNPLLWYAYHKMRDDQEIACDSLALTRITQEESKDYAFTIIKLLEAFGKPVHLASAASMSGNKKELKRRIFMIGTFTQNSYQWSLLGLILMLLLSGCTLTNAQSTNTLEGVSDPTSLISSTNGADTPEAVINNYFDFVKRTEHKAAFSSLIQSFNNNELILNEVDDKTFYTFVLDHRIKEVKEEDGKKLAIVEVRFQDRLKKDPTLMISGTAVTEVLLAQSGEQWIIESILWKERKADQVEPKNEFQPVLG